MRITLRPATFVFFALLATAAYAANATPVGTWTQVDDATHKPKSIVEISRLANGTLQGTVKKVLFSVQGTHPICTKCSGKRHDQPVVGMVILWGVKKDGKVWDGGHVLAPETGKVYKVKLQPEEGGQKLKVRGYVGFSLFGRTQTWLRKAN